MVAVCQDGRVLLTWPVMGCNSSEQCGQIWFYKGVDVGLHDPYLLKYLSMVAKAFGKSVPSVAFSPSIALKFVVWKGLMAVHPPQVYSDSLV